MESEPLEKIKLSPTPAALLVRRKSDSRAGTVAPTIMGEPLNRRELQRIAEGLVERFRAEPADVLLAQYQETPPPTRRDVDALTGQEFEYGVIAVRLPGDDVALAVFTSLTGADEAELKRRSLWTRITGPPMGRSSANIASDPRASSG